MEQRWYFYWLRKGIDSVIVVHFNKDANDFLCRFQLTSPAVLILSWHNCPWVRYIQRKQAVKGGPFEMQENARFKCEVWLGTVHTNVTCAMICINALCWVKVTALSCAINIPAGSQAVWGLLGPVSRGKWLWCKMTGALTQAIPPFTSL